jgi:hypothetical protein
MKIESDDAVQGWHHLLGQTQANFVGLDDVILHACPNLWIAIQGMTVEGEKLQEGDLP